MVGGNYDRWKLQTVETMVLETTDGGDYGPGDYGRWRLRSWRLQMVETTVLETTDGGDYGRSVETRARFPWRLSSLETSSGGECREIAHPP